MSTKTEFTCEKCEARFLAFKAKFCLQCRSQVMPLTRPAARKWHWTPERDTLMRERYDSRIKGRAIEVAKELGFPKYVVTQRAKVLGLSFTRKALGLQDWTPEEEATIIEFTGKRSSLWIARKLGRSETSMILKQKRMRLSRRVRVGYTLRDLCLCFGVDHHSIARWVAEGKLHVEKRGTARHGGQRGDIWCATEAAILRFILQNPTEFELRKVDQAWFMTLIAAGDGSGLVQRALVARREDWREPPAGPRPTPSASGLRLVVYATPGQVAHGSSAAAVLEGLPAAELELLIENAHLLLVPEENRHEVRRLR